MLLVLFVFQLPISDNLLKALMNTAEHLSATQSLLVKLIVFTVMHTLKEDVVLKEHKITEIIFLQVF